jgi:hypothetical protein
MTACGSSGKNIEYQEKKTEITPSNITPEIKTGADNYEVYLPLLKDKKVGIVTNQTGVVTFHTITMQYVQDPRIAPQTKIESKEVSLVDFLIEKK